MVPTVVFTRIKYQNFMSSGTVPINIRLDQHSSLLIIGVNGAGKSTVPEAIFYALFGKALRDINIPQLVNSVNDKDCLVEIEFRVGPVEYRIERGQKPAVFSIYKNGEYIEAPAETKDYQAYLEQHILHFNAKAFKQVVVLGGADYVPFMKLPAAGRRELIEDLLDIKVFSAMNALAKDDLSRLKEQADKIVQLLKLLNEQLRMAQSFTSQMQEQRDQQRIEIDAKLAAANAEIKAYAQQITPLTDELEIAQGRQRSREAVADNLHDYRRKESQVLNARDSIQRELAALRNVQPLVCDACGNHVHEPSWALDIVKYESQLQAAEKAVTALFNRIEQLTQELEATSDIDALVRELERKLDANDSAFEFQMRLSKDLEQQRAKLDQQPSTTNTQSLEELETRIKDATLEQREIAKQRALAETAVQFLKDSGIKARVVRHYLPMINQAMNGYLNALGLPILFYLDGEFKEEIRSRNRSKFTYGSFSDGQRKRIDLAFLLTWRYIARLKNSLSTNLLFFDEILDTSLDYEGVENFLKILRELEQDNTNIVVISHKTDIMTDKFHHTIRFHTVRGFSVMKKDA